MWRASVERQSKSKANQKGWTPSSDLPAHQLIAFPIHLWDPPHFSLGLLFNRNWKEKQPSKSPEDWVVLHVDSLNCTTRCKDYAVRFAKYAIGLDNDDDVKYVAVPAVQQDVKSNDCALYPAYYLDTILTDIPASIARCIEVSAFTHILNCTKIATVSRGESVADVV